MTAIRNMSTLPAGEPKIVRVMSPTCRARPKWALSPSGEVPGISVGSFTVPALCHALTSGYHPNRTADPNLERFQNVVQMTSAGVRSRVTESLSKLAQLLPSTTTLRSGAPNGGRSTILAADALPISNRSVAESVLRRE